MQLRFSDSIGVRFLRIVFGCYLFVTLLVTSTQLYLEYSEVEKNVLTELSNVGRSFEDGLAKALWNLDNDSIEFIIAGIEKIEVIAGVKVIGLQDDLQGATGVYVHRDTKVTQLGRIIINDIQAKEIAIHGIQQGNYYEYTLGIEFEETIGGAPELIGFMSLYANHDTVVQRFKSSFFLIIIIAGIKTIALWLIFLYFARRVVAKPISQLTKATQSLTLTEKHQQNSANIKQLEKIANSPNKDEIQLLANGFLSMQKVIFVKLDNLYTLNDFAVVLSKAQTTKEVFTVITKLLNSMFGCKFSVIFENTQEIFWSSEPIADLKTLVVHEFSKNRSQFSSRYYERTIAYIPEGASFSDVEDNEDSIPILTLPISSAGFEGKQFLFFGALHHDRLTDDFQLTKETRSFLQVIAGMMGNTLTNLYQREVIERQNESLERRVEARTKELASVNAELKHLAVHDPLTELPNRTLFNDRLEQVLHRAQRENTKFAVASIDLTKFKLINDNYGHDAGDAVLIEVGKRFSDALRGTDTLARMGGDEFAAIFTDLNDTESINTILMQISDSLNQPIILVDDAHVMASANIGVAIYPDHAKTCEQLFKYADIAMYHAKRDTKSFAVFDVQKNLEEKEYAQLMNELELAITREELILHYQPIVNLKTHQIRGFEALVRWEHPEKGLIPPNLFIPHAERSRHIKPLTLWVIRKACEQCVALQRMGQQLSISVNLSPRVFSSPDLPAQLQGILNEYKLNPRWIKLEVTESAAMTNPNQAMEIISKFSEMGSPISIDDFGTGHSSLAYLTHLPLNELKIDKSFLTTDSASNRVVVETIIELSHALDLKVVAEGIETADTYHMLAEKGCDFAQGYYIGRPIEGKKIPALLEDTNGFVLKAQGNAK